VPGQASAPGRELIQARHGPVERASVRGRDPWSPAEFGFDAAIATQVFHPCTVLGESETTQLRRLIELIEQALGAKAIIDRQPMQPGDVPVTFADIAKARELLNYSPKTKIDEGIPKFVDWFRNSR